MFATLADKAPRTRVGLAISLITGSQPVGGVIGSLLGGFVVQRWGVHVLFGFDAAMIALVVLMLSLLYHETFVPGAKYSFVPMLRVSLGSVLSTPLVLTMFAFSFVATLGYFFSAPFVPNRIVEMVSGGDSGMTIGLVYGIAGVATLIATPLWGIAADRFGHRRLLPLVTLLTAILYLPLYWAFDVAQFTLRLFLLLGVQPALNSLTFAVIGLETPPEKRSAVMSQIYMPLNAAILFAPSLAVVLTHEVRQVFLFSALFTFGAFVILWRANRAQAAAAATEAE
jgi:DHA1 family multidrug resistance protein-like MFS transporter